MADGAPRRERGRIGAALRNPGVLFSLIWQVFLLYPLLAVLSAGADPVWTVLGVCSIVAFSVVYIAGFAAQHMSDDFPLELRGDGPGPRADRQGPVLPAGLPYLAGLVVCAFGTAPAAGAGGMVTFLPFVACFAAAAWPLRLSVPTGVGLIAVGGAAAWGEGEPGLLIPAFLVVPVVMSIIGTRLSVGMSEREGRLRRALGAAEERDRVGRDLHDVLGHTLTALTIRAQLADRLLESDPDAARGELRTIEELTRTALAEMRQTVSGMRAVDPAAEVAEVTGSLRSAGVVVDLAGGPELVPARHASLAGWAVREAGTNILRHADASRATVEFSRAGVRVTDDGVGMSAPHGQGLSGLRARAESEGACLHVSAGPVGGTVVEVSWDER